jgi:hypothetical protein
VQSLLKMIFKVQKRVDATVGSLQQEGVPGVATAGEGVPPPPPHDPRERDLAFTLRGWEVRLFAGQKFQYFVTRGFWHLQLWHPGASVSVLTPSRLTCGSYEVFPVAGWKARAPDVAGLRRLVEENHGVPFLGELELVQLERRLVHNIVHPNPNAVS